MLCLCIAKLGIGKPEAEKMQKLSSNRQNTECPGSNNNQRTNPNLQAQQMQPKKTGQKSSMRL